MFERIMISCMNFLALPAAYADTLYAINEIFFAVVFVLYFYQNFYALFAIFTPPRKYPKAKKLHKYAYLICAHDEEKVVGNLVESIFKQDYPLELMKVFVVADNCKDRTAEVARNAGAIVFERTSDIKGKSFALDYALKRLFAEYDNEGFEAVFVFDADNLVSKEYTMRMNDTYDYGYKVSTSYRESKNFDVNWVTAGSSMLFYRECSIVHHSRSILHIGTYISGTGFYVDYNYIKSLGGWNYHTLVEDIEFSCDCANNLIKIGFNENAVFYDEQPETFKASWLQRLRWCRGIHECFVKYTLLKKGKHRLPLLFTQAKYEMHMHISPLPIVSFLWSIIYLVLYLIYIFDNGCTMGDFFWTALLSILQILAGFCALGIVHAFIVTAKRHKQIPAPLWKQILYCFTFPFFAFAFIPLSIEAIFKKVRWTKIEHTESIKIEEMKPIDEK